MGHFVSDSRGQVRTRVFGLEGIATRSEIGVTLATAARKNTFRGWAGEVTPISELFVRLEDEYLPP